MRVASKKTEKFDITPYNNFVQCVLNRNKCKKGQEFNFIDIRCKRSFKLEESDTTKFLEVLDNLYKNRIVYYYLESQTNNTCIIVDLDIIQYVPEKLISFKTYTRIIKCIRNQVYEYFKTDEFHMCVFEKPSIMPKIIDNKTYFKDGYHIIIYVRCEKHIRNDFISKLGVKIKGLLADYDKIKDKDIVDKASGYFPFLLPGSAKDNITKPYNIKKIYHFMIDESGEHDKNDITDIATTTSGGVNLVRELSLGYTGKIIAKIAHKCKKIIAKPESSDNSDRLVAGILDSEYNIISQLLNLLHPRYHDDFNLWKKVVFAVASRGVMYKSLAMDFSKRSKGWNPDKFEDLWKSGLSNNCSNPTTIGSLYYWAKSCDLDGYRKIMDDKIKRNFYNIINIVNTLVTNSDMGEMLSDVFNSVYIPTHTREKRPTVVWFKYISKDVKHNKGEIYKWKPIYQPYELYRFMGSKLKKLFVEKLADIRNSEILDIDMDRKKDIIKNYTSLIQKLGSDAFQTSSISQAVIYMINDDFYETLDSNGDLLGVGNGILKIGRVCKMYNDYDETSPISLFTPTNFIPGDKQMLAVQRVLKFVSDIIPERDAMDKILYYASTSLSGNPKEPLLQFLLGGGSNGKTTLLEAFSKTLGAYAKKVRSSLFTSVGSKSNETNSAVCALDKMRLIYFSEIGEHQKLYMPFIKEFLGGDEEISSRELYSKEKLIRVVATVWGAFNFPPILVGNDYGTIRRIMMYKCKIKFVNNPSKKNERQSDSKVPLMFNEEINKQAMLAILVKYYEDLQRVYGGKVSKVKSSTIDRETQNYIHASNYLERFIAQKVVTKDGNNVKINDFVEKYIAWYTVYISKKTSPAPISIIVGLERSRLAESIEKLCNGAYLLKNHRVLDIHENIPNKGEKLAYNVEN